MSESREPVMGTILSRSRSKMKGPNEISESFGYFVADILSWFIAGQLVATSLSFFVELEPRQIVFLGFTIGYITFLFVRRWKP